jgi:hypothetical protein
MGKQVRVYDNTYSVPIDVTVGQIVNSSTPKYFTGYSYLRSKKIKAISIMPLLVNAPSGLGLMLTLRDGKGDELLYNYPMSDLIVSNVQFGSPLNRMRLFNLYDLDLENSYWSQTQNVGYGAAQRIVIINFHY